VREIFTRRFIPLFTLLLSLAGCDYLPFGYTPIGEILESPGRFEGEPVRVRGEVVEITKIPFIEAKTYVLRDDSGSILVVTEGSLPALNKTVALKAEVKTMAIVDKQSFGLRLVEIERLPAFGLGD
jgi:hypothetical protein